ncbi:beta-lactamase/transpeptidase-like protein [Neurospora tetraspora]|uniref:Beta-lactamase/transpeptidase-like protein n=1 Tax=Neurospora tetraspora TaxID=94610 RepID=A0AAE0JG53_9PEZI|nr:beta-lactamase/transpeptidase-like protein [Neurospora tetraspora]
MAPTYNFETTIQKAIDDGIVPGVVLYARNKDGTLNYSSAHGHASLSPSHPRPMTPHTILALASMTKLLTSISVLQLLESSSSYANSFPLGLDTPVTDPSFPQTYLPDLASLPILSPTTTDPFATRTRSKHITIRHLLTHSSGCGYTFLQPSLVAWHEWKLAQREENRKAHTPGTSFASTVPEQFSTPLLFEPGEGWAYGCGIDWAGWLLEKVTATKLDDWMQENLVKRLFGLDYKKGLITFYPERVWPSEQEQEKRERVADMGKRPVETTGGGYAKTRHIDSPQLMQPADRCAFGGQGGFADLSAYCEVVYSLLVDDERLLKKETAKLLFEGQLKEEKARQAINEDMKTPEWVIGYVEVPAEGKGLVYDWSAGGLLVGEPGKEEDGSSGRWRRRGYLGWGGIFNLNWFVDREAGVCGVFGAQSLDPADPLIEPLIKDFEKEIYEKHGAK